MIHSENNVGFLSVSLAFRLSSWTVFYAQLPFPLMTATNVQGFKARGKAFGIVVTTLLSSRLHLIPSPAGKHHELYYVLILSPLYFPFLFFLFIFPLFFPFPFWFPASSRFPPVSRGNQVPRFHIFSSPATTLVMVLTGNCYRLVPWY